MTSHFLVITSGILVSGMFACTLISRKKLRPYRRMSEILVTPETIPEFDGVGGSKPGSVKKDTWVNDGSSDPSAQPRPNPGPTQAQLSGLASVSDRLGECLADAGPVVSAQQVTAELDAEIDPLIVDAVIWHIEQRTGKHKTIEEIWGAKKGGSKRFLKARWCYEQINAIYQAEVSASVTDSVRDRCQGDSVSDVRDGVRDVMGQEMP